MTDILFSDLNAAEQKLVLTIKGMDEGEILNLFIHNGGPDFSSDPIILRRVKLNTTRLLDTNLKPERKLKQPMGLLIQHMRKRREGLFRSIQVRGGLPRSIEIQENLADLYDGSGRQSA